MTRAEFINDITSIWDLVNFCEDNDLEEFVEDIVDDDGRDDRLDEYLRENAGRYDSWSEVLDILYNVPTGFDFYRYCSSDEIRGCDNDDYEELKNRVLTHCNRYDLFDEDEDEDEDEDYDEEYEDEKDDDVTNPEDMYSYPDSDDDFSSFIDASLETAAMSCKSDQAELLESLLF